MEIITLSEIKPLALALSTYELFEGKKIKLDFGSIILLKYKDPYTEKILNEYKKDLLLSSTSKKFVEGLKLVIIYNLDRIIGLAHSRFDRLNPARVKEIEMKAKNLIKRVNEEVFSINDLEKLKDDFKRDILLPIYQLFNELRKK